MSITQISPRSGKDFYMKGNKLYGNLDAEKQTKYKIEFKASYR